MVAPGDPERAAGLARRAASVSHDGKALYGAQVLAAMEVQAFVESDIQKLLDIAVSLIPKDSTIYCMIADIRSWHAAEPDWHKGREKIAGRYNDENYGGSCHMVPNHALIILGLLHGGGDFRRSMRVVNTAGWDMDCGDFGADPVPSDQANFRRHRCILVEMPHVNRASRISPPDSVFFK